MAEDNPFAEYTKPLRQRPMLPTEQKASGTGLSAADLEDNPFAEYTKPLRQRPSETTKPPKRSYKWSEVPGEAFMNLGPSAAQFYGDIFEAVTSPVETATGIKNLAVDLTNYARADSLMKQGRTAEVEQANRTVNYLAQAFKDRYGGEEQIKRTIAEKPFEVFVDISPLFTGGAGLVARAGGPAKVANALKTAGELPMLPVSAALGVGGRALSKLGQYTADVADPKSAALLEAAEGRGEQILNALQAPTQYVPGSMPTAAQAAVPAGSTKFVAFAESGKRVLPTEYNQRAVQQAQAAKEAVRTVSGQPGELEGLKAARKAQADVNYPAAFQQQIRSNPELVALREDPYLAPAFEQADKLFTSIAGSEEAAKTLKKSDLIKYLHNVKVSLDPMISAETNKAAQSQMLAKRDQLLNWLETRSSGYQKAREEFAEASGPIDKMKVGKYLEDKLLPAIYEGEDAAEAIRTADLRVKEFANALKNAPTTLKKSTGFQRYQELTDVLTDDQVKTLEGVRDDMARDLVSRHMAAVGRAGGAPDLRTFVKDVTEELRGPPLVKMSVTVVNDILRRVKGQMSEKMAVDLATAMLNPETAAEALQRAMRREQKLKNLVAPLQKTGKAVQTAVRKTPAPLANLLAPPGEETLNEMRKQWLREEPLITVRKGAK